MMIQFAQIKTIQVKIPDDTTLEDFKDVALESYTEDDIEYTEYDYFEII